MKRLMLTILALAASAVPILAQPTWTPTLESTSKGRNIIYTNNSPNVTDNEQRGSNTPLTYTATAVGGTTNASGGDNCLRPSGPPWWHLSGTDVTGDPIYRTPARTMRSPSLSGVKGIYFEGKFNGTATMRNNSEAYQVFFYHEEGCYSGYSEYGFSRKLSDPTKISFYVQSNANCGKTGAVYCREYQTSGNNFYSNSPTPGSAPPATRRTYVEWDLSTHINHRLKLAAWIYYDSGAGYYKFKTRVEDLDDSEMFSNDAEFDAANDTNNSYDGWFPIQYLYGQTGGYITVGMNWVDPNNCTSPGTLCIIPSSLQVDMDAIKYGQ